MADAPIYELWPLQAQGLELLGLGGDPQQVEELLFGGSAGPGKQLAIDTPIPTPDGWTTMGEIRAGDLVFGGDGVPTWVVATTEVDTTSPSFEIEFDSGEVIVCDSRHLWKTFNDKERNQERSRNPEWLARRRENRPSRALPLRENRHPWVTAGTIARNKAKVHNYLPTPTGTIRTTEEIATTLVVRGGRVNHSVVLCKPLLLPWADLPIDPYTFGLWLGDGYSGAGYIGMMDEDWSELEPFIWEPIGAKIPDPRKSRPFSRVRIEGLTKTIKAAGVYKNKHIPAAYLRASFAQRLEVLCGIMDSDGFCSAEDGDCGIGLSNLVLLENVHELVLSLGIKAAPIKTKRATISGRDVGETYRFSFVAPFPVFHLPRKYKIQRTSIRPSAARRFIVDVREIPHQDMRCIQVLDPRGMYLAGRSMIPTHNSHAVRAVAAAVAQKYPGSIFPIFRRTYPELDENMVRKALQEFPEDEAKWSAERKEFMWSNGSITEFRHCDREDDVYRYKSAEWQGLGIDEATDFTPFMLSFLRSRVRRPDDPEKRKKIKGLDKWAPVIIYATNPGGPGHRYLKEGFVDNEGLGKPWAAPRSDGSLKRFFLRGRLSDNPSLDEEDYMRVLEGIQDPVVRRAMAEGDWSIFAGQFFSTYRYDTHVCEPFEIPPDWIKWTGQDWGIAKWAACVWGARVPPLFPIKMKSGITVRSERPRTVIYREWMQKGLSTEEQAMSLVVLSNGDELVARYADPHMWDQSPRGGSIASDFIDAGWYIQKANNDRKAGWGRIQGMLQGHDMMPPELLIMDHCTHLKKAIEEAPRDKIDWEDLDTHYEYDDVADSLRYFAVGGVRTFKAQRRQRASYRVQATKPRPDDNGLILDLFGGRRAVR